MGRQRQHRTLELGKACDDLHHHAAAGRSGVNRRVGRDSDGIPADSQAKFVEVHRQEGGLVIVTGERAIIYSVPVPTATAYYVLDLFCRAMAMNMDIEKPGRSVSDVLALVKSAHGF